MASLPQDFVGKCVREVVLADDDFDVDADVAGAAEDFDDAARRRGAATREARDFDVDDGAVEFGKAQATIRRGLLVLLLGVAAELRAQLGSEFVARRNQDFMV